MVEKFMCNCWLLFNFVVVVCLMMLVLVVLVFVVYVVDVLEVLNFMLFDVLGSGYELFKGQLFFLLLDVSYGIDQEVMVCFEVLGCEYKDEFFCYGGVDIFVYCVLQLLEFLKVQKNLYCIDVKVNYMGEGLVNMFVYLWDNWMCQVCCVWQCVLLFVICSKVVEIVLQFSMGDQMIVFMCFLNNLQYVLFKGYELLGCFCYLIWDVKLIVLFKDVQFEGSSSEWML